MHLIIETKTTQVKNPNTKTTYTTENIKKSLLTEKQYNLTVNDDTLSWFRRLGGSETAQRNYTSYGYKIIKLSSKSPNGLNKTLRKFEFHSITYKENELLKDLLKEYKDGLFYLKRFKRGLTLKEVKQVLKDKLK